MSVRDIVRARQKLADASSTPEERAEAERVLTDAQSATEAPENEPEAKPDREPIETDRLRNARQAVSDYLVQRFPDPKSWRTTHEPKTMQVLFTPSNDGRSLIVQGVVIGYERPWKLDMTNDVMNEIDMDDLLDDYYNELDTANKYTAEQERTRERNNVTLTHLPVVNEIVIGGVSVRSTEAIEGDPSPHPSPVPYSRALRRDELDSVTMSDLRELWVYLHPEIHDPYGAVKRLSRSDLVRNIIDREEADATPF